MSQIQRVRGDPYVDTNPQNVAKMIKQVRWDPYWWIKKRSRWFSRLLGSMDGFRANSLCWGGEILLVDLCGPWWDYRENSLHPGQTRTLDEIGKKCPAEREGKVVTWKTQHDNARKLRGIYFIDPEDKEFKETIKNARKKLETSVAPAMPCKIKKSCGSGGSDKNKTKLACILEADESTRLRMGISLPNHHEDHIAGEGDNSLQPYNLVHKFITVPQAMKIPAAKAAVDKEWEKWRNFRRGTWRKSEVRKKWSKKQERRAQKFIFHHWWTYVIWKMLNWRQSTKNTKGRVVLGGDIVKDNSGSYAVFTEQGSSASPMTAAKIMVIISRLPGCAGQATDAIPASSQENGRC